MIVGHEFDFWRDERDDIYDEKYGGRRMIHTLTDATLDEFITSAPVVVVDFFATWCGPCKRLHTELDAISDTYKIGQIDVEENPVAMNTYNVISVPTLIVFQDGQPTQSIVGYRTRDELMRLI